MTRARLRTDPADRESLIAAIAGGLATLRSVMLEEVLAKRSAAPGDRDPANLPAMHRR
jgi:hypothetical protein